MQEIKYRNKSYNQYSSKDLAVIIPTKDRPNEINRLLYSITEQDCEVGRVIVVASGEDVSHVVMDYVKYLPVEYYSSDPGQIKQRNQGISLLSSTTKLVATLDDDVVFYKTTVTEMIRFWNTVEEETAGVGFNIVNLKEHKHNWARGLLGYSVLEPGKILKSGNSTSIANVKDNIRSDWLNGGGTVWRQNILKKYPHTKIKSNWAVCEDLIYSYPISKKYPLYICKNSKICIEDVAMRSKKVKLHRQRGKALFLWRLYFVLLNKDLSITRCMIYQCIQMIALFIYALLLQDRYRLASATGALLALSALLKIQFYKCKLVQYIEKNT